MLCHKRKRFAHTRTLRNDADMAAVAEKQHVKVTMAVVFTMIVWASAFVAIRAALKGYSPGVVGAFRFAVASVAIIPFFRKSRKMSKKDFALAILAGVLGISLYNLALNTGETQVNAASASFIGCTSPVFTALLASVVLAEKITPRIFVGSWVSLSGTAVIAFGQGKVQFQPAVLFVVAAAVSQAMFFVIQKPLLRKYAPSELTPIVVWGGAAALSPYFPSLIREAASAPLHASLAVIYLGIFPAAAGYVTWAYVQAHMSATKATSFIYCIPPVSAFLAWVVLREVPSLFVLVGGAIALIGVWLVNSARRTNSAPEIPMELNRSTPERVGRD
jgi:drug/metabolite transporter (DMT)-like permease